MSRRPSNSLGGNPPVDKGSRQQSHSLFRDEKKETYGLDIRKLKQWHEDREKSLLNQEKAQQEIAVAKVRGFLDAIGTNRHYEIYSRYGIDQLSYLCIEHNRDQNDCDS